MNLKKNTNTWMWIIIGWYVLLCAAHYFNQRPMWNDEQAVFLSIERFQPHEFFTRRLEAAQVFPHAYLFLIQQLSRAFDAHLLSLRFLAFVSMIVGFWLWVKISRDQFSDDFSRLTFLLCWPASALLIYYSAELKQYSFDVCAAAIFLLFLFNQKKLQTEHRRCIPVLAVLPVLGMFSYTAFLFMIFPLYNMVLDLRADKKLWRPIIVYFTSLIFFTGLSYQFDMRLKPTADVTDGFGDYFILFGSWGEFFKTFGEGMNNLFSRWFAEKPRIIKKVAIFFVSFGMLNLFYAFFANIKREGYYFTKIRVIALAVFIELFILGALKKYPFIVPRTALFYCPIVMYLTVDAFLTIKRWNIYVYRILAFLFWTFLLAMTIGLGRLILIKGDLGGMPQLW